MVRKRTENGRKKGQTNGTKPAGTGAAFEVVFPALKGVQARHEYYVSLCPLRLIPRLFLFNEEELVPELRAQRTLNRARVPEMARYLIDNRDGYVFSALTASIDGDVRFVPHASGPDGHRIGQLHIPMDSRFVINDGQHRRAAIELAMRENPDLADESIAVVFFLDVGLARCQQMFADLNRYAVRPSRSIALLYDHRDELAKLARQVVGNSPVFQGFVEMEKSTLARRSRKLFTLSAVHTATTALLQDVDGSAEERTKVAAEYWTEVSKYFSEWRLVREDKMSSGEVRQSYIHSHGIVLQALGKAGNALLRDGKSWKGRLKPLADIDWARKNTKLWEGRALVGGTVQKGGHNVALTTNVIKKHLKLPLSPEEQRVEDAYRRGSNGRE